MWQIWKSPCSAKFEELSMNGEVILLHIQQYVTSLYESLQVKLDSSDISYACMEYFNLCHYHEHRSNIIVRWLPPKIHWHKLNCDGSTRRNPGPAGGGGIIRKHVGLFNLAYYEFY